MIPLAKLMGTEAGPSAAGHRPAAYPAKVNIMFKVCNLKCTMCSVNANQRDGLSDKLADDFEQGHPELTADEFKTFFDRIAVARPWVSISGGEPTIRRDLFDIVRHGARTYGLRITMTTNGTRFTRQRIHEMLDSGLAGVTYSIDGTEVLHDAIRGPGNFRKTLEAVRDTVAMREDTNPRFEIAVLFAITADNHRAVAETADYLSQFDGVGVVFSHNVFISEEAMTAHNQFVTSRQLGGEFVVPSVLGGVHAARKRYLEIDVRELERELEYVERTYPHMGQDPRFVGHEEMKAYYHSQELYVFRSHHPTCKPVNHELTLLSDGNIIFSGTTCLSMTMGNIRRDDVWEIWNGERYRRLRGFLANEFFPICGRCCANRLSR